MSGVSALLQLIKRAAKEAVDASNPAAVLYGTVKMISPLSVAVEQRFTLTEAFLVVPETLTAYKLTIGAQEYIIRRGLEVGDKVVLLREQGGQQFIILDRVV